MPSTNEVLLDTSLEHSFLMERVKEDEARKVLRTLRSVVWRPMHDEILRRIPNIKPSGRTTWYNHKRMVYLDRALGKIIIDGYKRLHMETRDIARKVAKLEVNFQSHLLTTSVPISLSIAIPDMRMLAKAILESPFEGEILSDWWKRAGQSTRNGTREAILQGITRGESTSQIVSRLRKTVNMSRNQADSVVRTAITHTSARAREATWHENRAIVKHVQYVATLDNRTTVTCLELDGQTFPINDGPRPPMHFRCRSTTVPVLGSYKEFGLKDPAPATRASMDGQVSSKVTGEQFLKRSSRERQDTVLGKRRAQLFRKGMPLSQMTDRFHQPLTLQEIEKRYTASTSN